MPCSVSPLNDEEVSREFGIPVNEAQGYLCPALQWNGQRHVCALMETPGEKGQRAREALYEGAGCSSNLNSWRREPLQDRTVLKGECGG